MFDQQWWRLLVRCWEVAASNPLFELGIWGWPLGLGLLGALASRRLWLPRLALAVRRVQLRRGLACLPRTFEIATSMYDAFYISTLVGGPLTRARSTPLHLSHTLLPTHSPCLSVARIARSDPFP